MQKSFCSSIFLGHLEVEQVMLVEFSLFARLVIDVLGRFHDSVDGEVDKVGPPDSLKVWWINIHCLHHFDKPEV